MDYEEIAPWIKVDKQTKSNAGNNGISLVTTVKSTYYNTADDMDVDKEQERGSGGKKGEGGK